MRIIPKRKRNVDRIRQLNSSNMYIWPGQSIPGNSPWTAKKDQIPPHTPTPIPTKTYLFPFGGQTSIETYILKD